MEIQHCNTLKQHFKTLQQNLSLSQRRDLTTEKENHREYANLIEHFQRLLSDEMLTIQEITDYLLTHNIHSDAYLISTKSAAIEATRLFIDYVAHTIPDPALGIYLGSFYIAGTAHIPNITEQLEQLDLGSVINIVAEPQNPYDPRALKVIHTNGSKLGYLPKSLNKFPSQMVENGSDLFGIVTQREWSAQGVAIKVMLYLKG